MQKKKKDNVFLLSTKSGDRFLNVKIYNHYYKIIKKERRKKKHLTL